MAEAVRLDNPSQVFVYNGEQYVYTYLRDRGWHLVARKSRNPVSYEFIRDYNETLRAEIMVDLMTMAFACDFTRVATLMMTMFQSSMAVRHVPGIEAAPYGLVPNNGGADVHSFAHSGAFGGGSRRHALIIRWHVDIFARFVAISPPRRPSS